MPTDHCDSQVNFYVTCQDTEWMIVPAAATSQPIIHHEDMVEEAKLKVMTDKSTSRTFITHIKAKDGQL